MSPMEDQFLALLNSAPINDGKLTETLQDPRLRQLRDDLHRVIRGQGRPAILKRHLVGVTQTPRINADAVDWTLAGPPDILPLAEIVLEWSRVQREMPGRLRACGNLECNKFLIDHSKPNTARWCSMASCGNRMKARRFQARQAGGNG